MKNIRDYQEMSWFAGVKTAIEWCIEDGSVFVTTSAPGGGKTRFCRHVQSELADSNYKSHYFVHNAEGCPIGILRDILRSLDAKPADVLPRDSRLGPMIRILVDALQRQEISLLILDRADRACIEFYPAIFQVMDMIRWERGKFALLLTGDSNPNAWVQRIKAPNQQELMFSVAGSMEWTGSTSGLVTQVSGFYHINPLTAKECGAVLAQWCNGTVKFVTGLRANDSAALQIAEKLRHTVHGNFRLLEQFARIKNRSFVDVDDISSALIERIGNMMLPRFTFELLANRQD